MGVGGRSGKGFGSHCGCFAFYLTERVYYLEPSKKQNQQETDTNVCVYVYGERELSFLIGTGLHELMYKAYGLLSTSPGSQRCHPV